MRLQQNMLFKPTVGRRQNEMIPNAPTRSLRTVAIVALVAFLLAATSLCPDAAALDPHRQITQYGHTAWRSQDGFAENAAAITQTTEGYIWIGEKNGLARFDGVKFTPWAPPPGESLRSIGISYLLGSRDGTLWIGTYSGLSRIKGGKLFNYGTQPHNPGISQIIEDHRGVIWVTRYLVHRKESLCRVAGDELKCFGEKDGNPGKYGLGLTEGSDGSLWFGCQMLCRWSSTSFSAYFKEQEKQPTGDGVIQVVAGAPGSLWASLDGIGPGLGVQYFSNGKWADYVTPGFDGTKIRSHTLFVDHNKTLWVGTESDGLYHIHDGVADHYAKADGLSGNTVDQIYEDREGDLWVATDKGLDMFRDTPVVNFSTSEAMGGAEFVSVLSSTDGSVWVGGEGALNIIHRDRISAIVAGHGLPGQGVTAMCEDRAGRVWLGIDQRLMIYKQDHFAEVKSPGGGPLGRVGQADAIAEDSEGNIWAIVYSNGQRTLLRMRDERLVERIPIAATETASGYLAADRNGGIWIGERSDKLIHLHNGNQETVLLAKGDRSFVTQSISVAPDNAVWAATNRGLYRWKDGQFSTLDMRNGLPCSRFLAAIEDNYGSLWLNTHCGVVRIRAEDFANWLRKPESKVTLRVFDQFDGALSSGNGLQPIAAKSLDGRLWFAGNNSIQMVDPRQSYFNSIPPPVFVEKVIAHQEEFAPQQGLRLAPLTHDLEIQYTALSFVVPQKVKFRYMLQGQDKDWQDAGTRREAFYTNLGPGHYQFHVIACNNDGVWNQAGAELSFVIPPAYYQALWFKILLALIAAVVLWSLYLYRLRQATAQVHARLGERIDERERIARELHDTLLQGFQGLMLRFQAVMEEIPTSQAAHHKMEEVLERADEVLLEGRERVSKLRADATVGEDLAQAIAACGQDLAQNHAAQFSIAVIGTSQPFDPVVQDEAFRIAREALANAFAHSKALRIECEITYDSSRVRLSIRDNGSGIDPEILKSGRTGHWGLSGMRERAEKIGGHFNVWSTSGAGTEVELILPANVAYRRNAKRLRWRWIKRAMGGGR